VLGLRYAHSLGLFHGHLTVNNSLFDSDHCIQIVDFHPMVLAVCESEDEAQLVDFSRKGWTPETDIQAFASILSELVFGGGSQGEPSIHTVIQDFVSTIPEFRLSPTGCPTNREHLALGSSPEVKVLTRVSAQELIMIH
jgi:hypothetical protein